MEIELLPAVSMLPIVSVLIAPEEMLHAPKRQPSPTAIQDSFYHRHPFGHPRPAGPRAHRGAGRAEGLHLPPAQNHPGGEPPPLPDSGASAQRKGQGNGGPRCPGHEAGLSGGHPPVRPCIGPAPGSPAARRTLVFCFYDMQEAGLSQSRGISEEMAGSLRWVADLSAITC